jgi:hypothetical protein
MSKSVYDIDWADLIKSGSKLYVSQLDKYLNKVAGFSKVQGFTKDRRDSQRDSQRTKKQRP